MSNPSSNPYGNFLQRILGFSRQVQVLLAIQLSLQLKAYKLQMNQRSQLGRQQRIEKADLKRQELLQQDVSELMLMAAQGSITSVSVDVVLVADVLTALDVNLSKLPVVAEEVAGEGRELELVEAVGAVDLVVLGQYGHGVFSEGLWL